MLIVMSLFSKVVLSATRHPLVTKTVTGTAPGRLVAERFVAGHDLDSAAAAALDLNGRGLTVSLDLLGEEVHDRESALAATDEYLASIDRIASAGIDGNISIKLTQLGLAFDEGLAAESVERLAVRAGEIGSTVTIDMEASEFTDATVGMYEAAQTTHGNLGLCLQAYLHRTPEDLERLLPLGGHIRLCKGAYVEPSGIAFQSDDDVDAAFARLLERLMGFNEVKPAIATHDGRLITLATNLAERRTGPWEMQMLYGVRPVFQTELVEAGHPVRIYVPFGSEWYAYLTRRLAERPANLTFFARALLGRR
jgi:proline dehydrogenase